MSPFVFACIVPHGLPIIEELAKQDIQLMAKTRHSMIQIGSWMKAAAPETIIVLTPHGFRLDSQFCVVDCSNMTGQLSEKTVAMMNGETRNDSGTEIYMSRVVDRALAKQIIHESRKVNMPVSSLNFQTSEGVFSNIPLDWGAMVPLWFMPETPIVVITSNRSLTYEQHTEFGRALATAVRKSGKRIGLIASCDWSHTHHETGPYGYHEDASRLDSAVLSLFKSNQIEGMLQFDDSLVENAKPDGIWQALILAGAIALDERHSTFLSYEVPTYFGLLCMGYHQNKDSVR